MAWPATYLIFRDWGNWEFVRVPGREYWIDHAAGDFAGGSGGPGDPYVIETAEQLALMAKQVNLTEKSKTGTSSKWERTSTVT